MASEKELISALRSIFNSENPLLHIGIGDDAAVVASNKEATVLATDMSVEGTHFNREWSSLFDIGAKVCAANLADIYAMGGRPKYLLVAAALPAHFSVEELEELAQGICDEASKVGAIVVGGDLAKSKNLIISISVLGEVERPVTRAGAQIGDKIVISALPGLSAFGLDRLRNGVVDELSSHHRRPVVEYAKAITFAAIGATSMCDISDSLISELNHIADSSKVCMEINLAKLNIPVLSNFLHGGEDHVFLATLPPDCATPPDCFELGFVVKGAGVKVDGELLLHQGFDHF